MKKLLLLSMAGALAGSSFAQQNSSVLLNRDQVRTEVGYNVLNHAPAKGRATSNGTAQRPTATQSRWYSHYDYTDQVTTGVLSAGTFVFGMWFDTTVVQTYSNGDFAIQTSSISQVIDPASTPGTIYNNDLLYTNGEMQITSGNAYTVDSINIVGAYVSLPAKSAVVDTLIFSVAMNQNSTSYSRSTLTGAGIAGLDNNRVNAYIGTSQNNFIVFTPRAVDSVNRAAWSDNNNVPARVFFKVPLTAADATSDGSGTGFQTANYSFALPTPLQIPAGKRFTITATFKSGDTWAQNATNINAMNRFLYSSGAANDANTGRMRYTYYVDKDQNGSGTMLGVFDTAFYESTALRDMINANGTNSQFHNIGAYLTCTDCSTVGINDVPGSAVAASVYPNPAVNTINIPVSASKGGTVQVTLINAVGQTVAVKNMGKFSAGQTQTAVFSTSNIPSGVYMYSVTANGDRTTGRFVVSH